MSERVKPNKEPSKEPSKEPTSELDVVRVQAKGRI